MEERDIININDSDNHEDDAQEFSFRDELFDWVRNIAIVLTTVILLFVFVFRVIGVDGQSMEPTLKHKDWLVISDLFYKPSQGDIVVLTKKQFMDQPIVKRVIAVEGQEVDIDFDTGVVRVDGKVLHEDYIAAKTKRQFDLEFPQTVPENCVFVLGDNRMHSSDSRVASLGMVDERLILGKLIFRILPLKSFGPVK